MIGASTHYCLEVVQHSKDVNSKEIDKMKLIKCHQHRDKEKNPCLENRGGFISRGGGG